MENFEELLNTSTLENKAGVVKGVIVRKTKDGVLIDLKSKAERFISKNEFLLDEWESIKDGDEISVYVDGNKISYANARRLITLNELVQFYKNATPIEAKVTKEVKGGYLLNYKGVELFMPKALAGKTELKKDDMVKGIIKSVEEGKKIIFSIAGYLNMLKELALTSFFNTKKVGDIVLGDIRKIIDKGIFVNVEDVDCFVPFSELTYKRINTPDELFKVGDSVKAKIIEIKPETKKVTLSIKALEENPWERFLRNNKENDKVKGIVRNIIDTGVFVEIEDGVDGFLHVSEISWTERIKSPKKYFKIGDYVECIIKRIDKDNKKISLSFKDLLPNPWEEFLSDHNIGSIMKVKIKKVIEPGIVLELENGLEGFVPNENISWKYIEDAKKMLKECDEINVKLIAGDVSRKKLVFSIKDLTEDPWETFALSKKVGDEVDGIIKGINEKLIIVELAPYVEGIVKKSEFQKERKEQLPSEGERLSFIIKEIDNQKKRFVLSHLDLLKKRDEEALAELKKNNTVKVTLGDFFKK